MKFFKIRAILDTVGFGIGIGRYHLGIESVSGKILVSVEPYTTVLWLLSCVLALVSLCSIIKVNKYLNNDRINTVHRNSFVRKNDSP